MKPKKPPIVFLALLLSVCLLGRARAQIDAQGADERARRQRALELFQQGKRLEALPLLESLVQTNPRDDEMLVALAAALVDRAATLSDEAAAAKDRFRAR